MNRWVGVLVIVSAAVGIVGYKSLVRGTAVAAAQSSQKAPRVLLFADLREAEASCGCGEMIRAVRAAAAHGVPTRENDVALGKQYHVKIRPCVIILDGAGREVGRYEGEGKDVIAQLKAALDTLAAKKAT